MAIIKCPKCAYTVSDRAPACPKCKLPLRDALKPKPQAAEASANPAVAAAPSPAAPAPVANAISKPAPGKGRWWNSASTKGLFGRLESREDALTMVRDASTGFFVIAGLQALVGLFLAPVIFFDGVVYAILAAFLRTKQSRAAAVILLIVAVLGTASTLMPTSNGGKNVFLGIIMMVAAARAVEATFKLRGRFREEAAGAPENDHVPIIVRGRLRDTPGAAGGQ